MARRKSGKYASVFSALPQDIKSSILGSISASEGKGKCCDQMEDSNEETARPPKKRKLNALLSKELERYDMTGLVPHYASAKQVPAHLQKCEIKLELGMEFAGYLTPEPEDFFQRYRLFSRYSEGCLLDEEGWFSVTPEAIADRIAERCRCDTIIDAFCGVGGNAIAFAKVCERGERITIVWRKRLEPDLHATPVIAIDNSATRLALARHNAAVYGVADRIEFILGDFISYATSLQHMSSQSLSPRRRPIDVVFLSPPWGGVNYLSMSSSKDNQVHPTTSVQGENRDPGMTHSGAGQDYSLANVSPLHGGELFNIARTITPNIAYFLPRNQDLEEVSALVEPKTTGGGQTVGNTSHEIIEVEEEWMGTKLKALTCYFGGLAEGQEDCWGE